MKFHLHKKKKIKSHNTFDLGCSVDCSQRLPYTSLVTGRWRAFGHLLSGFNQCVGQMYEMLPQSPAICDPSPAISTFRMYTADSSKSRAASPMFHALSRRDTKYMQPLKITWSLKKSVVKKIVALIPLYRGQIKLHI
jgi:hypothetical protein